MNFVLSRPKEFHLNDLKSSYNAGNVFTAGTTPHRFHFLEAIVMPELYEECGTHIAFFGQESAPRTLTSQTMNPDVVYLYRLLSQKGQASTYHLFHAIELIPREDEEKMMQIYQENSRALENSQRYQDLESQIAKPTWKNRVYEVSNHLIHFFPDELIEILNQNAKNM